MLSYDEWIDALDEKAEALPRVQTVISNFQVLPRLGKLLSAKAEVCTDCKNYWGKLQESTTHFDKFFDGGNRYSADFDNLVGEILTHLKTYHKIRPRGLVLSLYTLLGMALGVVLGVLVAYVVVRFPFNSGIVLGWLLGTMGGWFAGKLKEAKMHKENLIF